MRSQALSAVKAGMTRLLDKGGASPDSLFELTNGYVNAARRPTQRPGTVVDKVLPAGTKGLTQFGGKLHVFASAVIANSDTRYVVNVLRHPTNDALTLSVIHFAEPFLGYLYVVAEFSDGSVWHYWLQATAAWTASTSYRLGQVVQPTVVNGYAYQATRLTAPGIPWAPDVTRAVGNKVEPTVPNQFEYTVVSVAGASPRSGTTEPVWPAFDGATVFEDTGVAAPVAPTITPPADTVPPEVSDRYGDGLSGYGLSGYGGRTYLL